MEKGRLRWRCRRGMKELDVVLGEFLENVYDSVDADTQAAFQRLLDLEDPELHACLLGTLSAAPGLQDVVERIRRVRR